MSIGQLLDRWIARLIGTPLSRNKKQLARFAERLRLVKEREKELADKIAKTKLKGCPFCGEGPMIGVHFKEPLYNLIHRCKIVGSISIDWTSDLDRLISRWNTRAEQTPPHKDSECSQEPSV